MKKNSSKISILAFFLFILMSASLQAKKYIPLDLAVIHNNQGVGYLTANDLDRAEVEFKTAVELDPLYPDARSNLGLIYKYKGHFDQAKNMFNQTIKLKPKWASPYNHLGTVYLAEGHFKKAEDYIKKATSLDKKYADAYYNLGVVYLEMAKEAQKSGKDPKPHWNSAVKVFQQATTIDTRLFHAHMDLADTYFKLGDNEKAILRYRLAIETNPKDPIAWEHLGDLYQSTGSTEKAKECYEKAGINKPMDGSAMLKMGENYLAQKKYDDALTLFQRALEKNPQDYMAAFDMGYTLAQKGQWTQAIQFYLRSLSLNPQFFPAAFNLGIAQKTVRDYKNAALTFQQILRNQPDQPESLYLLAEMYDQTAQTKPALQYYCHFVKVAEEKMKEEKQISERAIVRLGGCEESKPAEKRLQIPNEAPKATVKIPESVPY